MPSARWWRRPGCWRGGAGGCWTPRCGGRGRHPRHGHPAGRGDPSGPSADPGSPCGQAWRPRLRPAGQARLRLGRLRRQAGVGIGAGQRRAGRARGGGAAGAGRRPGRGGGRAAGDLQDRPAGRPRPGDLHGRPAACRLCVCLGHWTLCTPGDSLEARTNRGPGRPGPRCRSQATMPWGSITYFLAAPWSNAW